MNNMLLGDDAVAEPNMDENPFSLDAPENEDVYIDDPKKALRGYFEREGKRCEKEKNVLI